MHVLASQQDVSKEIAASIQGSEVKREKAEEFGEPATKKPRSDPCKCGLLCVCVHLIVCVL